MADDLVTVAAWASTEDRTDAEVEDVLRLRLTFMFDQMGLEQVGEPVILGMSPWFGDERTIVAEAKGRRRG